MRALLARLRALCLTVVLPPSGGARSFPAWAVVCILSPAACFSLFDFHLIDLEFELAWFLGGDEGHAGKVAPISLKGREWKCVLLPFRTRRESSNRRHAVLSGACDRKDHDGVCAAIALGPKTDLFLAGKIGRLHRRTARAKHHASPCELRSGNNLTIHLQSAA